jgi:Na+/H+-dicarboxylate symporter
MKKLALHWKILIGMILGILFGLVMTIVDGGGDFVLNWINPLEVFL